MREREDRGGDESGGRVKGGWEEKLGCVMVVDVERVQRREQHGATERYTISNA